jgi:hypothetical protein
MTRECPKCRNKMEDGYIMDEGYGTVHASRWVEGPPEKSFWTGMKTSGRNKVQVTTYRCTSCGYLESYAK